jgi:transposase-like protein
MRHKTKVIKRYTERYKQSMVSKVSSGLFSKQELCKQYGLSWTSLDRWCRHYGVVSGIESVDLHLGSMDSVKQEDEFDLPEDVAVLKQRLKELQVKLKAAELRAEAAEMIIDIAENDLGLNIRKKPAAKQSPE